MSWDMIRDMRKETGRSSVEIQSFVRGRLFNKPERSSESFANGCLVCETFNTFLSLANIRVFFPPFSFDTSSIFVVIVVISVFVQ